jgi:hypothetical protein
MDNNVYFEAILTNSDKNTERAASRLLSRHGVVIDYGGTFSISCHCTKELFKTIFGTGDTIPQDIGQHVSLIEVQGPVVYL